MGKTRKGGQVMSANSFTEGLSFISQKSVLVACFFFTIRCTVERTEQCTVHSTITIGFTVHFNVQFTE